MKVSNETKVGALAAIAITVLILGYNYMKGKVLFTTRQTFYAVYDRVDGLVNSNPVTMNGFKVGQVLNVDFDPNAMKVYVKFSVDNDVKISADDTAICYETDLFGARGIRIGKNFQSTRFADDKDTLQSYFFSGTVAGVADRITIVAEQVKQILVKVDTATGKEQLKETMEDVRLTLESVRRISDNTDKLLARNMDRLSDIFASVHSIASNLEKNNKKINDILTNMNKLTDSLAASNFKATIDNANRAIEAFTTTINAINNGQGTLGQLAKNEELYKNLNESAKSLDALLEDLKKNPKRYIHFSVFGGKK